MGKVRGAGVSVAERLVLLYKQYLYNYIIIVDWYFNQTLQMYNIIMNK